MDQDKIQLLSLSTIPDTLHSLCSPSSIILFLRRMMAGRLLTHLIHSFFPELILFRNVHRFFHVGKWWKTWVSWQCYSLPLHGLLSDSFSAWQEPPLKSVKVEVWKWKCESQIDPQQGPHFFNHITIIVQNNNHWNKTFWSPRESCERFRPGLRCGEWKWLSVM